MQTLADRVRQKGVRSLAVWADPGRGSRNRVPRDLAPFSYHGYMPDSFGKRKRRDVKAKKAAAREERRVARAKRREDRAAGVIEPGSPIAANEDEDLVPRRRLASEEPAADADRAEEEAPAEGA